MPKKEVAEALNRGGEVLFVGCNGLTMVVHHYNDLSTLPTASDRMAMPSSH